MSDETTIHRAVQDYYGERARSSQSCCDGPACAETLYTSLDIGGLPADVANFSLGCGDPVTLSSIQPGETVLDLGSGGGLDCLLAAERVGPQGKVIGVDMTPEMISRARSAAERLGLDHVEFRHGYIENLPVDSGTVDLVISNCVVNLAPDKEPVFQEIYRVLRPGGRLAITDIVLTGGQRSRDASDLRQWSACVTGALPAEQFASGLVSAGFQSVHIEPVSIIPASPETLPPGTPYSAAIRARKPATPSTPVS